MKTKFLFPNRFKRIGWILLIPSAILGFFVLFFDFEFKFLDSKVFAIYSEMFAFGGSNTKILSIDVNNITDEIVSILFLIGAILKFIEVWFIMFIINDYTIIYLTIPV